MAKTSKKKGKVKATKKSKKSDSEHAPVLYRTTVSGIIETDEKDKKERKKTSKKTTKKKTKKKVAKKKSQKKKVQTPRSKDENDIKTIEREISAEREKDTTKALTENFIALQKVMVNLSSKFDNLSTQISKLLELFEISAKSLAQKDFEKDRDKKESKEILRKLNNISQQAGLIGKGLVLIHESGSGKSFSPESESHEEKMKGMRKSVGSEAGYSRISPSVMMPPKEQSEEQDSSEESSDNQQEQQDQQNQENIQQQGPQNMPQENNNVQPQQPQPQEQINQEQPNTSPNFPNQNQQINQNENPQQPGQNQNSEQENNQGPQEKQPSKITREIDE